MKLVPRGHMSDPRILQYSFVLGFDQIEQQYVAFCAEAPDFRAFAQSEFEALNGAKSALLNWLDDLEENI
jgi:predicted RNase H-like HicB family nuclease